MLAAADGTTNVPGSLPRNIATGASCWVLLPAIALPMGLGGVVPMSPSAPLLESLCWTAIPALLASAYT
jgi:hypothetical protein